MIGCKAVTFHVDGFLREEGNAFRPVKDGLGDWMLCGSDWLRRIKRIFSQWLLPPSRTAVMILMIAYISNT